MLKLSPYKASMYLQCPARYKFYYISGFKALEKPKPYFFVGENVHFALKKFFDLPENERTYEALEKILRKKWKQNTLRKKVFQTVEEEIKYGKQALLMLRRFWEVEKLKKEPHFREISWQVNLSEDVVIMGKIDRVDLEEGGFHIIDYKTGKEREEEEENLQFLFYPVLAQKATQKNIHRVSFFYLNSGNFKTKNLTEEDFHIAEEKILKIAESIQKDKEFLPKPSNLCLNYCDFLEICPKRKEILKGKDFDFRNISPF